MRNIIAAVLLLIPTAVAAQELPIFPDVTKTPGQWHIPPTPMATLCADDYTKTVRDVPDQEKLKVFAVYGINPKDYPEGTFEIDHLVSLELDGTNDITNLWPQSYKGTQNAHMKDDLEDTLKHLVCTGKLALGDAQTAIRTNWYTAYQKYVPQGRSGN